MIRTCVLVSRENYVWHSMQEILPAIARCWRESASAGVHEVEVLDIDEVPLTALLPSLLRADNLVLSCFTFKMARLSRMIRERFSLDARFFIHLHNQATIGCWPWHVWGAGPFFREDDVFLSSCRRDAGALRLCFENPRVEVVPFTFAEEFPAPSSHPKSEEASTDFIFIGRLSPQKNLHTLLSAFRLFLDQTPDFAGRLIFFGGDDGMGSPNMGIKSENYGELLREISRDLRLQDRVVWRGHVEREALERELPPRYVFVSPSLHSDENFGMAAFRALCSGQVAVLSDWGGHADFPAAFPRQVLTVPVRARDQGPWISPAEWAARMSEALRSPERFRVPHLPEVYGVENISRTLGDLALETENRDQTAPSQAHGLRENKFPTSLQLSPLARKILAARERYSAEDPMRIFESYQDPSAIEFLRAYGMQTDLDHAKALTPLSLSAADFCRQALRLKPVECS